MADDQGQPEASVVSPTHRELLDSCTAFVLHYEGKGDGLRTIADVHESLLARPDHATPPDSRGSHEKRIDEAREIGTLLKKKFTNLELISLLHVHPEWTEEASATHVKGAHWRNVLKRFAGSAGASVRKVLQYQPGKFRLGDNKTLLRTPGTSSISDKDIPRNASEREKCLRRGARQVILENSIKPVAVPVCLITGSPHPQVCHIGELARFVFHSLVLFADHAPTKCRSP